MDIVLGILIVIEFILTCAYINKREEKRYRDLMNKYQCAYKNPDTRDGLFGEDRDGKE